MPVVREASAVGVKPLQWSDEPARYAQDWANNIGQSGELRGLTERI